MRNCLPTTGPCVETGHGCSDPEGMLLPFTQKVPREAVVERKQQQWFLSVSEPPRHQCPGSSPSVQLADTANSNSAAFSRCHNKLRAALMRGLGQEEEGSVTLSLGRAWVARKGSPFLSPLSYLNMHPHTFTFHNPASPSPQSPENVFMVSSTLPLQ